jgi:IclR family acetate operon transcriptional repressor
MSVSQATPDAESPGPKRTTIQSVSRASRILLRVATQPGGTTAKDVSSEFGLSLPTAYHLLATLVGEGLLAKDSRRRYTLGPKAGLIADAVMRDTSPPEYYLDLLRELADQTGETAYLSAWRQGDIQVLAIIEGAHAVRVSGLSTGAGGAPHSRASGKLLLAYARPQVRDQTLGSGRLEKRTAHTIVSRARLEEELELIRERGYATDHEEYVLGVTCVAAPIIDEGVALGAFTLSVPVERFEKREAELLDAVRDVAQRASRL